MQGNRAEANSAFFKEPTPSDILSQRFPGMFEMC